MDEQTVIKGIVWQGREADVVVRFAPEEEWQVHNHPPTRPCREYHLNGRQVGGCKIAEATAAQED